MRVRASTLRRAGLCLFLGVATSWLVAWGLVIAAWRGAWRLPHYEHFDGGLVVDGYVAIRASNASAACSLEVWSVTPAERFLVRSGKFWISADKVDDKDALFAWYEKEAQARGKPWRALEIDEFARSPATLSIGGAWSPSTFVHSIGWPFPAVDQVTVEEWTGKNMGRSPVPPLVTRDALALEAPWLEGREPLWGVGHSVSTPIRLPYRPNWPGLAINTAFYGGIFAIPLLGPPALRRTLRARRGRCTRCNYDLAGTPSGPCPECGIEGPRAPARVGVAGAEPSA